MTLFYLVITRYWPHVGVNYFGMVSNLNPITGAPLISADAMKAALSNPALLDGPVAASHPLQSRVGWFNINNISSAAFGLPVGFLVMYVVSMMTPARRRNSSSSSTIAAVRRARP